MNLVIGSDGVLGSALLAKLPDAVGTTRRFTKRDSKFLFHLTSDPSALPECSVAYLCAGTKGFRENEGNEDSFKADVDGNLRIVKHLLRRGSFVVFISAEGVQWAAHTAYCRNRLMVEMALILHPFTAIVRPGKFTPENVSGLVDLCVKIGFERLEGLYCWTAP